MRTFNSYFTHSKQQLTFFRSHFVREDGELFDIEYLPPFSEFPGRVQLQVAETAIYTRNTLSDANNDVVSDDCLCFLSNGNFIANAVNFLLLEPPVNLFIIPTLGLTFFSICLSCQYCKSCGKKSNA